MKQPAPTTRLLVATVVVATTSVTSLLGVGFAIGAGTREGQILIALGVVSGPPLGAFLAKALLWLARDAVHMVRITVYVWLSEAAVGILSLVFLSFQRGSRYQPPQFIPDSLVTW